MSNKPSIVAEEEEVAEHPFDRLNEGELVEEDLVHQGRPPQLRFPSVLLVQERLIEIRFTVVRSQIWSLFFFKLRSTLLLSVLLQPCFVAS